MRRTGSDRSCWGCPGGNYRLSAWWQPSRAMPWSTERARRAHAQRVLIGALTVRCRRVRAACRNEPERFRSTTWSTPTSTTRPLRAWRQRILQARGKPRSSWRSATPRASLSRATATRASLAVGYSRSTAMRSAASADQDVPRPGVGRMARWRNDSAVRSGQPDHRRTASTSPSAELRPDNWTPTRCPDYVRLDCVLDDYGAATWARPNSWNAARPFELVAHRAAHDAAEWKRRAVPLVRRSFRAFGRDRRYADHEPVARAAGAEQSVENDVDQILVDTEPAW